MKAIIALDQGTTSSRAIIFDEDTNVLARAQQEFKQHFPQEGWVEHDPKDIWHTQKSVMLNALEQLEPNITLEAIGITNQRETTIIWERASGEPIYPAIVWQDRRTADFCATLKKQGKAALFKEKTGLLLDPYFSGSKIKWILDHVEGARKRAEAGELCFGTIDTWLIWNLTAGQTHATDASNASRTLLFNLHTQTWDTELLEQLDIPLAILPDIRDSCGDFGHVKGIDKLNGLPISGVAGDQHAALFGQACFEPGMAKNTYGTGCFLLMQTGGKIVQSKNQLLTTVAWRIDGKTSYALEGSVFMGGATIQWLRDGLGIIEKASDVEALANQAPHTGGVHLIPAFAGLGAPYWDPSARAALLGMTRGTTKAHIARAALEAIAFQSAELLEAMEQDTGTPLKELRVDGGACINNLLMNMQADLIQNHVIRPSVTETTALGAAMLAGLAIGLWENKDDLAKHWKEDKTFKPNITLNERDKKRACWKQAVSRVLNPK